MEIKKTKTRSVYPGLFILLTLMILVLSSGCVQKKIYPSEKEIIKNERLSDLDNDGIPDEQIYTFEAKSIDSVNITREILVHKNLGNNVTVRLNIITKASDKITDITVRETIPTALALNIEKLTFTPKYSELLRAEPPITVSWAFTFSGRENIGKTIEYNVMVFQEIDKTWIEKYVQSPYIEVNTIDPENVPFFVSISKIGEGVYGVLKSNLDFYIATSIYASLIFIMILIYLELLALFGAYVVSLVKKTPLMSEVYNFIGHGRKDNTVWAITGIAMIVIGVAIIFFTKEAAGSADLETLVRLGSNVPKLIGGFAIAIGMISIYYSIVDILKGSVFGERYYMSALDMAKERIRQTISLVDELENNIMHAVENKIDTETEEIVAQVERKRMERYMVDINQENADQYLPQIVKSMSDVQGAIDSISGKGEVLENWPSWRRNIDELLKTNDKVDISMLADIPGRWRKWALTRYMSEHIGESLTIEEGALKRIKTAIIDKSEVNQVLNTLMSGGKVEGVATVRKDGLLVASMLPKEIDQNLIAAVTARMIANSDMASLELEKGKANFIILKGVDGDAIIYAGRTIILVSLVKKGETIGFIVSEMAKAIEKLDALI